MPEVQEISADALLPRDTNFVLVETTPNGKFLVRGFRSEGRIEEHLVPEPFATRFEAMELSHAWATTNCVPVIFVRLPTTLDKKGPARGGA
ncbi:hypothetical protein [Xanthobacter autotrophicus]|uniref:hypothetical protein n=1 Tax=Xanthobacter autotrophicus TaxID=280 RepID=UPI00372709EC